MRMKCFEKRYQDNISQLIALFNLHQLCYDIVRVFVNKGELHLLSLCRALWRILQAKLENLAG